jgi:hypothetical protein
MTACDSRLDVKPTQSIEESTALATSQDVEVTLIGAYDGLSSSNLYGGAVQYSGDLLGDDAEVRFGGTFSTPDELWRKAHYHQWSDAISLITGLRYHQPYQNKSGSSSVDNR